MLSVLSALHPATFQRHALNTETSPWPETNCYIDVWLPILHALQLDPAALLSFSLAVDYEGDQWTFAKPSLDDVWSLYKIDVQELNLWESLLGNVAEQVRRGRLVLVEVDSFYLPDTRGTAYMTDHTKTTIAINAIDVEASRMEYFHSGGYFEVSGQDFCRIMQVAKHDNDPDASLEPYAEFVKLDRCVRTTQGILRATSQAIAQRHMARRPLINPFAQWREHFADDMETLVKESSDYYHRYAFASLRQIGSAFYLASVYLRWLEAGDRRDFAIPAAAFDAISSDAKALLFKLARAMNRKALFTDLGQLDTMQAAWDRAFSVLPELLTCVRQA